MKTIRRSPFALSLLVTEGFLAAAIVASGVTAAGFAAAAEPAPKPAAGLLPVSIAATDKSQLERQDLRAQLSPRRFTTLSSELGAKVNRLTVKEGEAFRAGQPLIGFDCSLQQAQLQKANAALAAADKSYAANKRLAELHSAGQVEVDMSEAEAAKARADLTLIHATLSKCTVYAPFAGRVAEQKVREQQYAQPGQALLEIIDDSTLELEFIVPSRWLIWLKGGSSFQVRIDETGRSYPARITRLGARVDPVSQSVKVVGNIDGRFPDLMAGMSGQILIQPPVASAALR